MKSTPSLRNSQGTSRSLAGHFANRSLGSVINVPRLSVSDDLQQTGELRTNSGCFFSTRTPRRSVVQRVNENARQTDWFSTYDCERQAQ